MACPLPVELHYIWLNGSLQKRELGHLCHKHTSSQTKRREAFYVLVLKKACMLCQRAAIDFILDLNLAFAAWERSSFWSTRQPVLSNLRVTLAWNTYINAFLSYYLQRAGSAICCLNSKSLDCPWIMLYENCQQRHQNANGSSRQETVNGI